MTLKKYRYYRLALAMILAASISSLVATGNYLLPLIAATFAWLIMYNIRQHVDGILADECDYALAGKSARYTLSAVSMLMMVAFFILMHFAKNNEAFHNLAMLLAYLTYTLLLINASIFQYLKLKMKPDKTNYRDWLKTFAIYALIALIFASTFIGGIRLFSGEDDWICRQGTWQKHGQPTAPMPQTPCLK